jgi:hypothetical protein
MAKFKHICVTVYVRKITFFIIVSLFHVSTPLKNAFADVPASHQNQSGYCQSKVPCKGNYSSTNQYQNKKYL